MIDAPTLRSTVETIFRNTPSASPAAFDAVLRSATADIAAAAFLLNAATQLQREIAIQTAMTVRTKTMQRCYRRTLPVCNGRGSIKFGDGREPNGNRTGRLPGPDVVLDRIVSDIRRDTDKLQTVRLHLPSRGFYRVWLTVQEDLIRSIEGRILDASFCQRQAGPRCVRTTTGETTRCIERQRPPILRQQ